MVTVHNVRLHNITLDIILYIRSFLSTCTNVPEGVFRLPQYYISFLLWEKKNTKSPSSM